MNTEEVRSRFPVLRRLAYLNAGTFGPVSQATHAAMTAEHVRALEHGRSGADISEAVMGLRETVRARIADLVGVASSHVSLTASTTDGCNIVLLGLSLTDDDEVVTTSDEHFGLLGPLGASPAQIVVVPPDPDRIVAAVTPRTKLVALSHVLWTTGAVLPVAELRLQIGVPFLVDGAQSVGAVPVDASAVDFYTVSGQKWLCGPGATGALVVNDPERLKVAHPAYFAQLSHAADGSFEARPGAARFDPNWIEPGTLAGLLTAIDERPPWAFEQAARMAEQARERLAPHVELVTPANPSTIASFRSTEAGAVVRRLAEAGVVVRELPRRDLVRVCVGYWTSDNDLARLVDGLRC